MSAVEALFLLGDVERCLVQGQRLRATIGKLLLPPPEELRLVLDENKKAEARRYAAELGAVLVEAATHLGKLEQELQPYVSMHRLRRS